MSKAFTKEGDGSEDEDDLESEEIKLPTGTKNYMTPAGEKRLRDELQTLLHGERPKLVETIAWAAGNGDRSENADYIYGKRRLREIDRRIRFLSKRLEAAEIVDPLSVKSDQVRFGATVTLETSRGEKIYSIVGIDEADAACGRISWISPLAKALLGKREGDDATFQTPRGEETVSVAKIQYLSL